MMICHHRMGDNGNGPDRVIVCILLHKHHKKTPIPAPQTPPIPVPQTPPVPRMQPMVIQEPFTVPDEDSGSSGNQRKSDRENRAKKHKPMDSDEDDEVPQNEPGTYSNTQPPVPVLPIQSRSTSSSHGPSNSTTSTSSQRTSTITSSEDESADNDHDHGEGESGPAIQSARSHESGRTVLCPDLYVLTNDEHWTTTPESHKYTAAAGSFRFVTMENGEQHDIFNLTTMQCVQRSLCLEEVTDDSSSTRVELPNGVGNQTRGMLERCMAICGKAARARAKKRSRARQEASAQEVRGYYKQFAEAKHL